MRKKLTEYLCKLNKHQIFLENIRQTISSNPYFQTISVFDRFDKFRKGHLIPSDFSQFMLQNSIYPTQIQLYLIFRDFDEERVGIVTLQHFQQELLPRENKKLKKEALSRKPYPTDLRLQIDLQFIISKYFQAKVKHIKQLQAIRAQMKLLTQYNVQQSFSLIDYAKNGYISNIKEIDQFLRHNGQALKHQDLVRIFRVLNFKKDGYILYQTFSDHLEPFLKGVYPFYKQRALEQEKLRDFYFQRKNHIDMNILENSRRQTYLISNISDLKQSNRKLQQILQTQDRQLQRNYLLAAQSRFDNNIYKYI